MTEAEDRERAVADPVGLTVDLLTRVAPDFDPDTARRVVTQLVPGRAKARRLALALTDRPTVLSDGQSPAPLIVGALLLAVRAAGAHQVCAPTCTTCRRPLRGTLARIGQDWYCHPCGRPRERCVSCGHERAVNRRDRHGHPHCLHCPVSDPRDPLDVLVAVINEVDPVLESATIIGAARQAAPGSMACRRLAWAIEDRPELLTGAGHHATIPAVLRLIDALCDAGAASIIRPACPGCGRVTRLVHCHDGQRICRRCNIIRRRQACARCGKAREPGGRDEHGQPLCSRCLIEDPANHESCTRCSQRRPVHARTPDGPFCGSCRPKRSMRCTICGRTGPAEISRVTGQPWCDACQQRWARCVGCEQVKQVRSGTLDAPLCAACTEPGPQPWRPCPRCGIAEQFGRGPCPRCGLAGRLREFLADNTGTIAPELILLYQTLVATERPATVLDWLDHGTAPTVLSELGHGTRPLTHAALDELTPSKPIEHLRSVLVATGALPERDEHLARLERWIAGAVQPCPDPDRRRLLRHYAHWHLLRRLRTRNRGKPLTDGQASSIRVRLRGAIVLLDWLADHQRSLTTATQADIDQWLASGQATHRRQISGFLNWATANQQITTKLEGTRYTWDGPADLLDGEQRWAIARRLLHDESLKPEDRTAGLLVLLYAQRGATISQLTTDHVETDTDRVQVRLGTAPITLPEPLATLVRTLVATRTGHATVGERGTSTWLFPGGQPGRPISTAHMGVRLRGLGIRPNPARSAALFSLATELPAAILARMLGINIDVAVTWQQASAGDWTTYAADVSARLSTGVSSR